MTNATVELLECGHPESAHLDCTRGYGTDDKGNRSCYACCTAKDRALMASMKPGDGTVCFYLSGDGRHVTNWPGEILATVQHESERRMSGFGGYHKRTFVVAFVDGNRWSGFGGGRGMFLRLRRTK